MVTFHGAVKSGQLENIYTECDVFVLPSKYEPWGLVVNEALSYGLPVIAPVWVGAACDMLLDGHNGFRLLTATSRTIASAMAVYITDKRILRNHKLGALNQPEKSGKTVVEAYQTIKSLFTDQELL